MRAVKIFFLASSLPLSLPLALVRSTFSSLLVTVAFFINCCWIF